MKAIEINPKNTFSFLSLVSICLIYYIDNTLLFNTITSLSDYHEDISELHYMKEFFLSKAKSYTTFSTLSKNSKPALILDLVLQGFFNYEGTFQINLCTYQNAIAELNFPNNRKNFFDLFLVYCEINQIEQKFKSSSQNQNEDINNIEFESNKNLKNPNEILEKLKDSLKENKSVFSSLLPALQKNINSELQNQIKNLSAVLSEKNQMALQNIVSDFEKFIINLEIYLFTMVHCGDIIPHMEIVSKIFNSLNSLENLQQIHGNLINISDIRPYYKSLLVSYYHYLVNAKRSLSFLQNNKLSLEIENKIELCLSEISAYEHEKKKITKDDIIWPFMFLTEKNLIKNNENSEFIYNVALKKIQENKFVEAKKLLQKSILLNPSEKKYRETYTSFIILIENEYFKNEKLLQFQEENKLHFIIKTLRESLKTRNELRHFSKILIYYQSIDIFYLFCRCLFQKNEIFDVEHYKIISKFSKVYLNRKVEGESDKKYLKKLMKLILEMIFHFNLMISNKKIFMSDLRKESLEKIMQDDLNFIKNHAEYSNKIQKFHEIIEAFYSFDRNSGNLDSILKIFNSLKKTSLKIAFLLVISIYILLLILILFKGFAKKLISKNESKNALREIKLMKELIKNEVIDLESKINSLEIKRTINKLQNAISYLEVYLYIIAVNEMHKNDSQLSKFEILSLLKDSAENVFVFFKKKE